MAGLNWEVTGASCSPQKPVEEKTMSEIKRSFNVKGITYVGILESDPAAFYASLHAAHPEVPLSEIPSRVVLGYQALQMTRITGPRVGSKDNPLKEGEEVRVTVLSGSRGESGSFADKARAEVLATCAALGFEPTAEQVSKLVADKVAKHRAALAEKKAKKAAKTKK